MCLIENSCGLLLRSSFCGTAVLDPPALKFCGVPPIGSTLKISRSGDITSLCTIKPWANYINKQRLSYSMSYYIIIRGPLGSGKSTVSSKLCKLLNAEHISIDRVLDEHNLTKDKERGYISQKSFKKANEIVVPKIKDILKSGKLVVIDGNFYWKSQIDDLIERLKHTHRVFTLTAPVEVCIDRDIQRGKTHGEAAARVVHKKSTEFTYGTVIDITQPLEKAIKEILSHLPKA